MLWRLILNKYPILFRPHSISHSGPTEQEQNYPWHHCCCCYHMGLPNADTARGGEKVAPVRAFSPHYVMRKREKVRGERRTRLSYCYYRRKCSSLAHTVFFFGHNSTDRTVVVGEIWQHRQLGRDSVSRNSLCQAGGVVLCTVPASPQARHTMLYYYSRLVAMPYNSVSQSRFATFAAWSSFAVASEHREQ